MGHYTDLTEQIVMRESQNLSMYATENKYKEETQASLASAKRRLEEAKQADKVVALMRAQKTKIDSWNKELQSKLSSEEHRIATSGLVGDAYLKEVEKIAADKKSLTESIEKYNKQSSEIDRMIQEHGGVTDKPSNLFELNLAYANSKGTVNEIESVQRKLSGEKFTSPGPIAPLGTPIGFDANKPFTQLDPSKITGISDTPTNNQETTSNQSVAASNPPHTPKTSSTVPPTKNEPEKNWTEGSKNLLQFNDRRDNNDIPSSFNKEEYDKVAGLLGHERNDAINEIIANRAISQAKMGPQFLDQILGGTHFQDIANKPAQERTMQDEQDYKDAVKQFEDRVNARDASTMELVRKAQGANSVGDYDRVNATADKVRKETGKQPEYIQQSRQAFLRGLVDSGDTSYTNISEGERQFQDQYKKEKELSANDSRFNDMLVRHQSGDKLAKGELKAFLDERKAESPESFKRYQEFYKNMTAPKSGTPSATVPTNTNKAPTDDQFQKGLVNLVKNTDSIPAPKTETTVPSVTLPTVHGNGPLDNVPNDAKDMNKKNDPNKIATDASTTKGSATNPIIQ